MKPIIHAFLATFPTAKPAAMDLSVLLVTADSASIKTTVIFISSQTTRRALLAVAFTNVSNVPAHWPALNAFLAFTSTQLLLCVSLASFLAFNAQAAQLTAQNARRLVFITLTTQENAKPAVRTSLAVSDATWQVMNVWSATQLQCISSQMLVTTARLHAHHVSQAQSV